MERKARPAPVPPAEPRRRRGGLLLAAVAVARPGGPCGLLPPGAIPRRGAAEVVDSARPAMPGVPREVTPTEVADPDEARRAGGDTWTAAERFAAMRAAYQARAGETACLPGPARASAPGPLAGPARDVRPRLPRGHLSRRPSPSRWTAPGRPWPRTPACGPSPTASSWTRTGSTRRRYVLLAPASAAPGVDVLGEVEREFLRSTDARECLSRVGALGSVEYELRVDLSGITYRTRTDLPREVQDCVEGVLGRIITSTAGASPGEDRHPHNRPAPVRPPLVRHPRERAPRRPGAPPGGAGGGARV